MRRKKYWIAIALLVSVLLSASSCIRFKLNVNVSGNNPDTVDHTALRPDHDLGLCRNLSEDILVAMFYMNDFESMWTNSEIKDFTEKEILPALDFLEDEAEKYDVKLRFEINEPAGNTVLYYGGEVITSIKASNGYATSDVLDQAASRLGFEDDTDMIEYLKARYQVEEVICLTIFNKDGNSYAIDPPRGSSSKADEHCIIFSKELNHSGDLPEGAQASMIASSILYLYGGESFSTSVERRILANFFYRKDIMFSAAYDIEKNEIARATAYYIGWIDSPPAVMKNKWW